MLDEESNGATPEKLAREVELEGGEGAWLSKASEQSIEEVQEDEGCDVDQG